MAATGSSQVEIAAAVGCHQSTVGRTIRGWVDTRADSPESTPKRNRWRPLQQFVKDATPR
jgi:hypothetical protein